MKTEKTYYIMYNVGRSKYVVSYCTGTQFHQDGSLFFDIKIFKNKKNLSRFTKELEVSGYTYR